jgi:two-component system, chemotaxis family, protein-glutamate methylesterase/glutaminase
LIRVLIVDDSSVVRKALTRDLSRYSDIEVVGSAIDPYDARDKIIALRPDILTLDIEMPRMDGLSFLRRLMKFHPMPVVVVSSVAKEHSKVALRALELGAMEVVSKPGSSTSTPDVDRQLIRAIRSAAGVRVKAQVTPTAVTTPSTAKSFNFGSSRNILAIGASTGGTRALADIMSSLPANTPGTLLVQHMPKNFTEGLAKSLDRVSAMEVREARDGDQLRPGLALLAPGDFHMLLVKEAGQYKVRIRSGPQVHFQRPAVDPTFQSVAKAAGAKAVGVVLTGMGKDGAVGLLAMKQQGAFTLAQDEKSSVVFGMPRAAIELGGAVKVESLGKMTEAILKGFISKLVKV